MNWVLLIILMIQNPPYYIKGITIQKFNTESACMEAIGIIRTAENHEDHGTIVRCIKD